jgi:uncharacterized low-complexity protein
MTLIQLLEQARELAYKEHDYVEEDGWYSCGAHESCHNDAIKGECTCGADKHNQKVDEVFEQLNIILLESYND